MLPTLYKKGKRGQVEQWSVSVISNDDGTASVIVHSGQVDGVLTEYRTDISVGKNLGRKNATSPLEQALGEAASLFTKKKDRGYSENPSGEIHLEYIRPMLALPYMSRRSHLSWPMYAQPKLDGIRCVVSVDNGRVTFTSRNGKVFTGLTHLVEEVLSLVPDGGRLDCELYSHGVPLQTINSLVRTSKNPDLKAIRDTIQLHVFDIIDFKLTFAQRIEILQGIIGHKDYRYIRLVETHLINDETSCDAYLKTLMVSGYEGLMLRTPSSMYLANYRSEHLLKYKTFQDAEFRIVGVVEGRGGDKGCAIFVCLAPNGKEFGVRCAATREERKNQFVNGKSFLGKMLTVKFQEYTIYGVPEFPVGVCIRDYE